MATTSATNKPKLLEAGRWHMSWKRFLIAASVTLNIGFVVLAITMVCTHSLDGMFINEGISRYCNTANDDQFANSTAQVRALRDYTCQKSDAASYFENGLNQYLDAKHIAH